MKINKYLLLYLLIWFFANKVNAIMIDTKLDDHKLESIATELFKNIKCIACQGQSILDSESSVAKDMRNFIRNELRLGKNKEQIENYLVDKFGADILLTPPLNIHTYLLWFFPIVSFLIVIAIFSNKYKFNSK